MCKSYFCWGMPSCPRHNIDCLPVQNQLRWPLWSCEVRDMKHGSTRSTFQNKRYILPLSVSNHLQPVEIQLGSSCLACCWPLKTSVSEGLCIYVTIHFQNNSISVWKILKIAPRYISSYICQGNVTHPDVHERWAGSQMCLGFKPDNTNVKMCSFCVQSSIQTKIVKKCANLSFAWLR